MMGGHHAITGAAAWATLTSTVPGTLGLLPMEPVDIALGAVVCAGAALLPDADHPSATIAHAIPVLGKAGANAISGLAGGHRHGTHALLALPVIALLAWLLQFGVITVDWWPRPIAWACAITTIALVCFAVKALGITRTWFQSWLVGAGIGAAIALSAPAHHNLVAIAVVVGFITHLAGDFLTVGGLPLLWPWNPKPPRLIRNSPVWMCWMPNGYFSCPILGKTGSMREWLLATAVTIYLGYILVAEAATKILALTGAQ